jgi:DNA-binding NtrC family response regulator
MMVRGQFREDLYYRLKVIEAVVPPLRERPDEIPQLTDFFITKYSERYNRPPRTLSDELRQRFLRYDWPGNVRELENMIKRFVILQDEQLVLHELTKVRPAGPSSLTPPAGSADLVPPPFQSPPRTPIPGDPAYEEDGDDDLDDDTGASAPPSQEGRRLMEVAREAALTAERSVIADTLRQVHWNRRKAAQLLGVSYKTLLNKIKETGLEQP